MNRSPRSLLCGVSALAFAAAALVVGPAFAAERAALAPGAGKQRALAVEVDAGGVLAAVCDEGAARCDATEGARLVPPASARASLAGADVRVVSLRGGRHVVLVTAPKEKGTWSLLLAAPADGGDRPSVVWSGTTADGSDPDGERKDLIVAPAGGGGSRITLTTRRSDLSVCGRGATTSPRVVEPTNLQLVPAPAEDPLGAAGEAASVLEVRSLLAADASVPPTRALSALAGSRPGFSSLVDGDASTAWAPEVPGGGRHETVTFLAAPELPIDAIEVHLVPPAGSERASARGLFVATPERVYALRSDLAVPAGGLVLQARFPEPLGTRCLAIVMGDTARGGTAANVAEVVARTAFDAIPPEVIARGLGGADGRGRAAWLARAGDVGFAATKVAYPTLDPAGQDMARRVVDARGCADKAPFYAEQLADAEPDARRRALDRVTRCGEQAVPALTSLLEGAPPDRALVLVDALGLSAPSQAVGEIVSRLARAEDATSRRALRSILARVARRGTASPALEAALVPQRLEELSLVARVDVLRALVLRLPTLRGGPEAVHAAVAPGAAFRTRYLLAPAVAELARGGDARARDWLAATMASDPDPRLRTRAVGASGRVPALALRAAASARDPSPRVREAAAVALGLAAGEGTPSEQRLASAQVNAALPSLLADRWTFVRDGAAAAAAAWPSEARADASLAKVAAADPIPQVRRLAVRSLGLRGASAHVPFLRERASARAEDLDVRAEAHRALGVLCDAGSLAVWTDLAARSLTPMSEEDRKLGAAALDALAEVHPTDLAARLAALLGPEAPREVREHASRAVAHRGRCGGAR